MFRINIFMVIWMVYMFDCYIFLKIMVNVVGVFIFVDMF